MLRAKILLLFTLFPFWVFAQKETNDTLMLPEVSVKSLRLKLFSAGTKVITIDSIVMKENYSANLTELLTNNTPVYIQDYGAGSLATISFRGTNSSQSQVNWNGFTINSSTLGDIDLSLIPVSLMNNINMVYGGAGSIYGSGAIGGSVNINNTPTWFNGSKLLLSNEYGSFSTNRTRAKLTLGNGKIESTSSIFLNSAKNNYPFQNIAMYGSPEVRQTNASLLQYGGLQSISFRPNDKNIFSVSVWYQNSWRHLPPTMTSYTSHASQQDSSLRTFAGWSRKINNGSINVKGAFFSEELHYKDVGLDSKSKVNKYMLEGEWRHFYLNGKLATDLGINFIAARGFLSEYNGVKTQPREGFYAGAKYYSKFWTTSISIRKDFVKDYNPPFAPLLGVERKLIKNKLVFKSNVAKNYRIPTLNDRYWQPGGNPNLKAEQGWSKDIGFKLVAYVDKKELHILETEITSYSTIVNNWIQWRPIGNYWSPQNIQKVWARGGELHLSYKGIFGKVTGRIIANYAHTVSTNITNNIGNAEQQIVSLLSFSILNGNNYYSQNQLIYIPQNTFNVSAIVEYKNFFLTYNQTYTDLRYVSTDDAQFVNGYSLGNIYAGKKINASSYNLSLQLRISNIWNTAYQNVQWYAMPGRAYYLTLQIEFINKHKTI